MGGIFKAFLKRYFGENLLIYYIIPVIFILGIVFGILGAGKLNAPEIKELSDFIDGFINSLPTVSVDAGVEIRHAIMINLKTLFYIWFLGLTVIGIPLTLVITFIRGFVLGFTVGFLVAQKSTQGFFVVLLTVLPQNLILVPVILIAAISSISFSLYIIRGKFMGRTFNLSKRLLSYTVTFFILGIFSILAAFIQGFVSPSLVKALFYFS